MTTSVDSTLPYVGPGPGGSLLFREPGTFQRARLSDAFAYDATGTTTPLAMAFHPDSSTYDIVVRGPWLETAKYPVVIDPTLTFEDALEDPVLASLIGIDDDYVIALTACLLGPVASGPSFPEDEDGSIVLTVSGGGGVGDGPALEAGLNRPQGLALDGTPNAFIADRNNHRIRVFNGGGAAATFNGVAINAGEVGTIAGTGKAGFAGDGGPAIEAQLLFPDTLVVDASGDVYFSSFFVPRNRRIDTAGTITTLAGTGASGFSGDGGPAAGAEVGRVRGMVVRGDLLIFIDQTNNRVRAVNIGAGAVSILGKTIAAGSIDTLLGSGVGANTGDGTSATFPSAVSVNFPFELALDGAGNLYVAAFEAVVGSVATFRIRVVNLSATPLSFYPSGANPVTIPPDFIDTVAGGGTDAFGQGVDTFTVRMTPTGLDVDSSGNLFWTDIFTVAPFLANRIRRIDRTTGIATTISPLPPNDLLTGFAGDGGPASDARWQLLQDLRIHRPSGEMFLADANNNRIRKVAGGDPTSIVSTVVGTGFTGFSGDDALSYTASLGRPSGVRAGVVGTADEGRFFVADTTNNRVFQVEPGGRLTTLAGKGTAGDGGPAVDAFMRFPFDLAFDAAGNLYVCEIGNPAIRVINRQGTPLTIGAVTIAPGAIATVAGVLGSPGFNVEGGPATTVQLRSPASVELSPTTPAVYITDQINNRLAGTAVSPIPGVTITASTNGVPTDPTQPGFLRVIAESTGPPPPPDFRIGAGAKSIYFTIDAVNLTFGAGNQFTITIFWDEEFTVCKENPPAARTPKLFRFDPTPPPAGGSWKVLENLVVDCTAKTTTGTSPVLSTFKVFEAIPLLFDVAVEPQVVKINPGLATLFLTPADPFVVNDVDLTSLTVNDGSPTSVHATPARLLVKIDRSVIVDQGDGTGRIAVFALLLDGRPVVGEAIVPIK